MYRTILLTSLIVTLISVSVCRAQSQTYQLSGSVSNQSGTPLIGAYVLINPGNKTVAADENGRFSVQLPEGTYVVECQYLGMVALSTEVELKKNTTLRLKLKDKDMSLKQVEVTAKSSFDVNSTNMGSTYMDVKLLTKMPALLGEVDVIRSVSSLPGVVSAGEGTAGFYVRGGSADQNLVLLDDVPVFNSSHLFGFFSIYNPDILDSYTLHRSGISAQ